jgi:(2Fe-2S) ferredoxin
MGQYRHHVFVCTSGKSCARDGADDVYAAMKKAVKEAGLKHTVRVNHAGCMKQCGHGPMVVVYPQDVWYAGVGVDAGRRIVAEHLVGGRPVERLRYRAPPGDNRR